MIASDTILIHRIDAALPQTQCRRCGYDGCEPYAAAVAAGEAPINQCPPGGEEVVRELAHIMHCPTLPLDPRFGPGGAPALAVIDEARCIGCTLCIQACPVDAIVGAAKRMHTVIAAACTGCELCLPPCPVDCIVLEPAPERPADKAAWAALNRARYQFRRFRLARAAAEKKQPRDANRMRTQRAAPAQIASAVAAAMERARKRRAGAAK